MKKKILKFYHFLNRKLPGWILFIGSFFMILSGFVFALYHSVDGSDPAFFAGCLCAAGAILFSDGIFAFFDRKSKEKSKS